MERASIAEELSIITTEHILIINIKRKGNNFIYSAELSFNETTGWFFASGHGWGTVGADRKAQDAKLQDFTILQ